MKKLIERLVVEHNSNKDVIIDILSNKMNLRLSPDALIYINKLLDCIEPMVIIKRSNISKQILDKTVELFNSLQTVSNDNISHKEQPLPDPVNGRPYIDWKECDRDLQVY